jgi:hypothetical protein
MTAMVSRSALWLLRVPIAVNAGKLSSGVNGMNQWWRGTRSSTESRWRHKVIVLAPGEGQSGSHGFVLTLTSPYPDATLYLIDWTLTMARSVVLTVMPPWAISSSGTKDPALIRSLASPPKAGMLRVFQRSSHHQQPFHNQGETAVDLKSRPLHLLFNPPRTTKITSGGYPTGRIIFA